mmetsp:Transcript_47191/g.117743  ORF Transcript_47191/g.117743 Transcript_47191/m.117743 type:complete len:240 (+) Transcript_47191:796-1515(+)
MLRHSDLGHGPEAVVDEAPDGLTRHHASLHHTATVQSHNEGEPVLMSADDLDGITECLVDWQRRQLDRVATHRSEGREVGIVECCGDVADDECGLLEGRQRHLPLLVGILWEGSIVEDGEQCVERWVHRPTNIEGEGVLILVQSMRHTLIHVLNHTLLVRELLHCVDSHLPPEMDARLHLVLEQLQAVMRTLSSLAGHRQIRRDGLTSVVFDEAVEDVLVRPVHVDRRPVPLVTVRKLK